MRSREYLVTTMILGVRHEIAVAYTPGESPSWDSPGDGGELYPIGFVTYETDSGDEVKTWETLILEYAVANCLTLDVAESEIIDKLLEEASLAHSEAMSDY